MPNLAPRRRLVPAAAVLFIAGACVLARLSFLQVLRHGYYAERAEVNQQERVPLPPARGEIRDRHGNLLAQDRRTYSLIAVPRNMAHASEEAGAGRVAHYGAAPSDRAKLGEALAAQLAEGDVVLIKGSRGSAMEEVARVLEDRLAHRGGAAMAGEGR